MQRVLALESSPALATPLRFFLSAPIYLMAAGALVMWSGADLFASRWSPATLATTHLLVLGFLGNTMVGALLQILPVVAGIEVAYAQRTAAGVHGLLNLGALALAGGFLLTEPAFFKIALVCLLAAFGWLLLATLPRMLVTTSNNVTFSAIRLALLALLITVVLGGLAAGVLAWALPLPLLRLANLHAGWGLAGWVGLLLTGVAYQVIPMFQVTEIYPPRLTRWLAGSLFGLLLLWSLFWSLLPQDAGLAARLPAIFASIAFAGFAIVSLSLLRHRKRPAPDTTTRFWMVSLGSLLLCLALWNLAAWLPQLANAPAYPIALGLLFVVGFAGAAVCGMLYKIVPFLVWMHLHEQMNDAGLRAPHFKNIIAERLADRQWMAHGLALLLLLFAACLPDDFARSAGAGLLLSGGWLGWNLWQAMRVYRGGMRELALA
jgi:hypothetical protein